MQDAKMNNSLSQHVSMLLPDKTFRYHVLFQC